MFKHWWSLTMLAAESQHVMWLRSVKLAKGGRGAAAEGRRMVSEKLAAAAQATAELAMGGSTTRTIAGYRRKVRANRRRLSK